MTDPIPPAAKAAYQAWQKARGVPEGPGGDCGWSAIGPVPQRRWEAAAMAASPVLRAAERRQILERLPGRVGSSLAEIVAGAIGDRQCCDLHGRNCEPYDLCCGQCAEADHPLHRRLGPCSNPDLSPNTLAEAAKIAAAVEAVTADLRQIIENRDREIDQLRNQLAALEVSP